jgi:hypothetical protein
MGKEEENSNILITWTYSYLHSIKPADIAFLSSWSQQAFKIAVSSRECCPQASLMSFSSKQELKCSKCNYCAKIIQLHSSSWK